MRQLLSRLSLCLIFALSANTVNAQDINLLPQYGGMQKNAAQLSAD